MKQGLKIGELAERSGCLVETIRYYERVGLLARPQRAQNNYRAYTEAHAETLQFIRHCRALDMPLDEIRVLLGFREHPNDACSGVNELLDTHISHVGDRIRALSALEAQLIQLRSCCAAAQRVKDCGILHALAEA
jgi:Cd(II)/Pb(II)-responsive transcriptional regulator